MLSKLDHVVLTVRDLDATLKFYISILGMRHVVFDGRHALHFGRQKINLHVAGREFEPKAERPTPGSGDLCFLASASLAEVQARLAAAGIAVIEGPVERTGATGPLHSIYVRDPDGNLIEIAEPQS